MPKIPYECDIKGCKDAPTHSLVVRLPGENVEFGEPEVATFFPSQLVYCEHHAKETAEAGIEFDEASRVRIKEGFISANGIPPDFDRLCCEIIPIEGEEYQRFRSFVNSRNN